MSIDPNGNGVPGDRRSSERLPVDMWVEEATDRELYFQRSANISEGGIYLEHTIPHPRGTRVSLRFILPRESEPLQVRGEIVNVSDAPGELGMGVKFVDLDQQDLKRIQSFIQRAGAGASARQARDGQP